MGGILVRSFLVCFSSLAQIPHGLCTLFNHFHHVGWLLSRISVFVRIGYPGKGNVKLYLSSATVKTTFGVCAFSSRHYL